MVASGALLDHPAPTRRAVACVLVAGEGELVLRRIAVALHADGLAAAADAAATAAGLGAVIAFACDVSRPAPMAALRRLRRQARESRIVVVTPPTGGTGVRRAIEAGADGVVFESDLELTLAPAVRASLVGLSAVPQGLRRCVARPAFSHRERQVLGLATEGLTNSEIAERIFLSESTVKTHLSTAFTKLGVRSRKEAAALMLDPCEGLAETLGAWGPQPGGSNGSRPRTRA